MYVFFVSNEIFKKIWPFYVYCKNPGCRSTNYFSSVQDFFKLYDANKCDNRGSYEIMCHPGHENMSFLLENQILEKHGIELKTKMSLFNYNSI